MDDQAAPAGPADSIGIVGPTELAGAPRQLSPIDPSGKLRGLANDCVHCGFSLPACPTYQLWGEEMDSPRGRIHLISQILDGATGTTAAAAHLDRCLGCMACVPACPSGVRYDVLIGAARSWAEEPPAGAAPPLPPRSRRERAARAMIFATFPYPRRLRPLMAPLRASQGLRLDRLLARTGLADRCADVVVCIVVLQVLDDHGALLGETARLLKPGGRAVITTCLRRGWNSVLFDGSSLPVEENLRQTVEVVAEARSYGASVEGEIEAITGVEDGIGSDEEAARQSLPVALDFIRKTGVDVFAPAIGNAHGVYRAEPHLDAQRVSDIVAAEPIPIALHGGTGMTDAQFTDLIARGCAKVNISTALKVTYMQSSLAFLRGAEERGSWDPPSLFTATRTAVKDMAADHMRRFGSAGQAW